MESEPMRNVLHISSHVPKSSNKNRTRTDVLIDQIMDSAIVGGITFLSTLTVATPDVSVRPALIAGALTFLIKLKEYRGIK